MPVLNQNPWMPTNQSKSRDEKSIETAELMSDKKTIRVAATRAAGD